MYVQKNHSSKSDDVRRFLCVTRPVLVAIVLTFMVVSMLLSAKASHTGENSWTWTGLGGWVIQILADPLDSNVVYARTYEGVWKTTDGGNTWTNITESIGVNPSWITMAPGHPNVLYTTAEDRSDPIIIYTYTYRTNDGGATWQQVHTTCCVYAVSPADWREAYLGEVVSLGVGYTSSKLHKTVDGGQTWTTISGWPESYGRIQDIVIAPSAPNILIATTERPFNGIMYKSINSGQSWFPIGANYIEEIYSVTFDPKNSNTIYLATKSPGGWKSTDGGATWQPLANGLQPWNWGYVINPDNTQVIHAANREGGVRESLDGGASWAPINQGIDGLSVRSIAVAAGDPLEIYAGMIDGAGVWKLTRTTIQDFGITINNGDIYTNMTGVTLTLTAPPGTTQMIISNDGGFGGASWEPFVTTKPWTITSHEDNVIPRTVYAKFKTNGQISGQYQDDIVLDQTAPIGTIQIEAPSHITQSRRSTKHDTADNPTNTFYFPFVANKYFPGRRLVTILLSATDDVSGVDSMLLSNDGAFADARWQLYTTKLDWSVPDEGITIVYVKYRDRAGNESQVYSATIPASQ